VSPRDALAAEQRRFTFVVDETKSTLTAKSPEKIAAALQADSHANPHLVRRAKTEAERNHLTAALFARVAAAYDRQQAIDHGSVPIVHRNGTSRERRSGTRRIRRTGARAGPNEPHEPERADRPHLTPELRRWLRSEIDVRRREQVKHLAKRDLALFDGDPGRVKA
jgi:hypothetical protein